MSWLLLEGRLSSDLVCDLAEVLVLLHYSLRRLYLGLALHKYWEQGEGWNNKYRNRENWYLLHRWGEDDAGTGSNSRPDEDEEVVDDEDSVDDPERWIHHDDSEDYGETGDDTSIDSEDEKIALTHEYKPRMPWNHLVALYSALNSLSAIEEFVIDQFGYFYNPALPTPTACVQRP